MHLDINVIPGYSRDNNVLQQFDTSAIPSSSPSDIITFPNIKIARRRKRRSTKSTDPTSTLNMDKLVQDQAEKESQLKEKERKAALKKTTAKTRNRRL